jgi:hypothetical protein
MNVIDQLSSSKGQRGEAANIALAKKIAASDDKTSITELIRLVETDKPGIQNDAVKTLSEVATLRPDLVASHVGFFAGLLSNQNNRLQWGAMTALDAIAAFDPDLIAEHLDLIVAAASLGSVITNDHAMGILVKLAGTKKHAARAVPPLFRRLKVSPANQFGMYAEMCEPALDADARKEFLAILQSRLKSLPKVSQQKRIEKLIQKITPTP